MRYSLGLGHDWGVDKILLDKLRQRIDLYISYSRGALIFPETRETGTLYDHRKARTWRHLDWSKRKCFIHCRVPRIQSSAEVKTIEIPLAGALNRFTHTFERWTIDFLKAIKNQIKTATLLRCGFDIINRILHCSASRGEKRRSPDRIQHLSVDEKTFQRGHTYATTASDTKRGVVLDVGEGRDKVRVKALLNHLLEDNKAKMKNITTKSILQRDCAPVFRPALAMLGALREDRAIDDAIQMVAEFTKRVADSLSDLGHDHTGPLYYRILGSAKSNKAFCMDNMSAIMLARLAIGRDFAHWSDENAVARLRVIDSACGTGRGQAQ